MKKIIIFTLLLSLPLMAETKLKKFYPNISTAATTNGPWGISYETFPGGSGLSEWPFNSLSIGLGNRFQIGTTPLLYAVDEHKSNLNLKWNFYQGEQLYISFGFTSVKWALPGGIEITEADGNTTYIDEMELTTGGFSFNYFFKNNIFAVGFNLNYSDIKTGSDALDKAFKGEDGELPVEWVLDLSMTLDPIVVTIGMGEVRADTFDFSDDPKPFGFGTSVTYVRKAKWFPHFGLGYYYIPDLKDATLLIHFGI